MAESVALRFTPPAMEDLKELRIYESPAALGPFQRIDSTLEIGTYPDWIDNFTTDKATAKNNWFAIEWLDQKGASSGVSTGIKGGTGLLIADVIARVKQRDITLSEGLIGQEAEAVIEQYFRKDPYAVDDDDVSDDRKYQTLVGLTYLIMARAYIAEVYAESETDYTAGLISQKASSRGKFDLDRLVAEANLWLGTGFSVVGLIEDIEVAGGLSEFVSRDQSRLLIEIE